MTAKQTAMILCMAPACWFGGGCAALTIGEMDNALPQGKGVLRIGGGFDVPLAREGNDTIATRKQIAVVDKSQRNRFSGKIHLRYGLSDNTDLSLTAWYATLPGFGLRATVKQSFDVSPQLAAAVFGSLHHFFTINEVPYWEITQNTYNRTISGLTMGGVSSLRISKDGVTTDNTFSLGLKFSLNYAHMRKKTTYFADPFSVDPPPPPETKSSRETFYVATPFLGASIGSSQQTTFYLEALFPVTIYDRFESVGPFSYQVSVGMLFRLID